MKTPLTTKQRRLRQEIEEIAAITRMDHWNISDYAPASRTTVLEIMKNRLVRSEVVMKYAIVDEFLTMIICNYYFRRPPKGHTYRELWRTKKFTVFNHYVMDEIYLLAKLRIVRAIREVPAEVRQNVERINALRNAIAHSLFPENRRDYMLKKKLAYRDHDIFTRQGIEAFEQDVETVRAYLARRAFGAG